MLIINDVLKESYIYVNCPPSPSSIMTIYPVIDEPPLLAKGMGSNVIEIELVVTVTKVGGFAGYSGKSAAITSIESLNKLSPIVLYALTLNL